MQTSGVRAGRSNSHSDALLVKRPPGDEPDGTEHASASLPRSRGLGTGNLRGAIGVADQPGGEAWWEYHDAIR